MQPHVVHASAETDFNKVFATLDQLGEGALVIGTDAFFDGRSERLAALAVRQPFLLLLRILACRFVTVGRLNRLSKLRAALRSAMQAIDMKSNLA
jgi:hypothetical protein